MKSQGRNRVERGVAVAESLIKILSVGIAILLGNVPGGTVPRNRGGGESAFRIGDQIPGQKAVLGQAEIERRGRGSSIFERGIETVPPPDFGKLLAREPMSVFEIGFNRGIGSFVGRQDHPFRSGTQQTLSRRERKAGGKNLVEKPDRRVSGITRFVPGMRVDQKTDFRPLARYFAREETLFQILSFPFRVPMLKRIGTSKNSGDSGNADVCQTVSV